MQATQEKKMSKGYEPAIYIRWNQTSNKHVMVD